MPIKKIISAYLCPSSGDLLQWFDDVVWDYSEDWDGDVMGFVENLIDIYDLHDTCYASTKAGAYSGLICNDVGEVYLVDIDSDTPKEMFWVEEDWKEEDEDDYPDDDEVD